MIDTKAFRSLSYGLYIVSSKDGDHAAGCVANTFAQVTSTPPRVSVALNKGNHTAQVVQKTGVFSVSCLAQDANMELIGLFGFQSSADVDKFANVRHAYDAHGAPYITEQSVARFAVKVRDTLDVGTHLLFVGDVTEAAVLSAADPLTYAHYHQVKGGKTPPKAPGYTPEDPAEKIGSPSPQPAPAPQTAAAAPYSATGWRCCICSYIEQAAELPDGYICPICGASKSQFTQIMLD